MRIFISINISEELKEETLKLQESIDSITGVNIIPINNLHITLKFLGENKNIQAIIEKLRKIKFEPFEIYSLNTGFFPNENHIKVVWIGFERSTQLEKLFEQIEDLIGENFEQKFSFSPHLTIARIKNLDQKDKSTLMKLKETKMKKTLSKIGSFKLMKSTLTPLGPIYEVLEEFKAKSL